MEDRIVGIRQAAPRLNMSPKTLQRLCTKGESPIPARRTTGGWVFRDSDITAYIDALFDGPADVEAERQGARA